ncbi:GGDEF domain-containing protein [Rhodococcus ruber]|uniref:GGDEF domain-containing protein n=1 Tax=Rhodococcus ruber TaxID=1830 RepID=A0ABT4M9H3_9NOCA|nr:GGDEF domain-containing protein [Rhodococcus ruber]MCZ4517611.1 GGDEF domain-containing protein [Rhodococcus ruber]
MQSTFLRTWWNQPHSYESVVSYLGLHGALAPYRLAASLSTFSYGLGAAALLLLTDAPPTSAVGRWIFVVAIVSTLVVGVAWLKAPWPSKRVSLSFAAYSDVGTTLVLLAYGSPQAVFLALAMLAANSVYVQLFHSPRVMALHLLWAGTAVALFFVLILLSPNTDTGLAVAQLVVLVPITFMGPTFFQYLLLKLQVQAQAANFDPLTQVRNRRGLDEALPVYFLGADNVAVMVVDVDRFKSINDLFGHHQGDAALQLIARRLAKDGVLVARVGGEEFAVVTKLAEYEARALAEEYRSAAHSAGDLAPLTVSIGVAHCEYPRAEGDGIGADVVALTTRLLRRADAAMYEAKKQGGNQVVVADLSARGDLPA